MDLCDALQRALYRVEVERLEDVFDRYSLRELALLWLGLDKIPKAGSDRHRDYLSARRRFERYLAGLGRGARGGRQTRAPRDLEDFLDSLRERIERRRPAAGKPLTATIAGEVQVSKDRRRRTIGNVTLPGECVDRILDLLEEELCDEAVEVFEECFGEAAGMGASPQWHDVDRLVLR